MPATWRAAVAGFDLITAACAALNLAYFCYRLSSDPPETASRRLAAMVLAVISFATVVESLALLAAAADRGSPLESAQWALVRGLALAGAMSLAALVLRRLLAR
ncbi:MAG TPA: hypothetical protein VLS25_13685 [Dehalococcoidia bacterium]|nr:hypothetical protein [Dehalococcoidia bacterium]